MFRLGETIKRLRTERGVSQHALAAEAGLTASYLSLLENGKRSPSLRTVDDIASALDVPLEVILWDAVEIPEGLSDEDQETCESAKAIVRHFYEATDAPSSETSE